MWPTTATAAPRQDHDPHPARPQCGRSSMQPHHRQRNRHRPASMLAPPPALHPGVQPLPRPPPFHPPSRWQVSPAPPPPQTCLTPRMRRRCSRCSGPPRWATCLGRPGRPTGSGSRWPCRQAGMASDPSCSGACVRCQRGGRGMGGVGEGEGCGESAGRGVCVCVSGGGRRAEGGEGGGGGSSIGGTRRLEEALGWRWRAAVHRKKGGGG